MASDTKPPLSKEMVIEYAQKGAFDNNPLLSTVHIVICPTCKCRNRIVLLEHLKVGDFKIGNVEQIEVLNPEGAFLLLEQEKFTPVIVKILCKNCSSQYEARIVSAEYLKMIVNRPQASKSMYA